MTEHAKLAGPSAAPRHFACAASAQRELIVELRNEFLVDYGKEVFGIERAGRRP